MARAEPAQTMVAERREHAPPPEQRLAARNRPGRRVLVRAPIPKGTALALGLAVWALFFGAWYLSDILELTPSLLLPSPSRVAAALYHLFVRDSFAADVGISVLRVVVSFALASIIAIPLGIAMGSFRPIDAFFGPFVSAWRYLPAPSFIPLLLVWFGIGETSKLTLLFIGVVFFLITLVADHTRNVRAELIETSLTLGASDWQVVRTVITPAVMPDVVTSMRQMLAVSWTYLVIAEIMAPTTGIGAMMMRAKRFLDMPNILAGIAVVGVLGLAFDALFRVAHRLLFPYLHR